MKIHAGDTVVVISGKDKGKVSRVLRVLPEARRLVVAGVSMRTRFVKKTPQGPGRQVRFEASIAASKVMLVDPKTKKRSRVGYRFEGSGDKLRKQRFSKESGEALLAGAKLREMKDTVDDQERALSHSQPQP